MVDTCFWFAGNKGSAKLVTHTGRKSGDPFDHRVVHIFIGAEVDIFGFSIVVDDVFAL